MARAAKDRTLGVLVIGCGRIAGGAEGDREDAILSHAAAYAGHGGFQLAACVEPDENRRAAFMKRWNVKTGFSSMDEVAASGTAFDVASVCTPTKNHYEVLRALLKSEVDVVWCEKPITDSAGRSREIVESYRSAGKGLAVNYIRRWHPAMSRLRDELEEDIWGKIHSVVGFYTKGVRNNGSHLIDLINFLIAPVEPMSCVLTRADHDPEDLTIDAMLRTDSGVPVHIVGGDARDYALFELEIIAALGSIRIEQSGRTIRTRRVIDDPDNAGYRILGEGQSSHENFDGAFLAAAGNIYRSVVENAPLESDGASALQAERICDELIVQARKI